MMDYRMRIAWISVLSLSGLPCVGLASAGTCTPPPEFVNTPPPQIAPPNELVSHVEEITVDRPLRAVLTVVNRPLSESIQKSDALPGVSGSYMLSGGSFGAPGSRRLNCLTDGSTLVEQVLQRNERDDMYEFRYVVWNYTSPKARPIVYGLGEFTYSATGDSTHIRWIYSFDLNRKVFPGKLGGFGAWLFRRGFLDRDYAAMMRSVLLSTKTRAEQPQS